MDGDETERSQSDGPFSRAFKATEIPAAGIAETIEATGEQRDAVAALLGIVELALFRVEFRLISCGLRKFRLKGQFAADVVQNCVVTLDPVQNRIEEEFDIEFWPSSDVERMESGDGPQDMDVPVDGPEPLPENGMIDVGHVAYELLASALDPYPRKPGAEFSWKESDGGGGDSEGDKPFANLDIMLRRNDPGLS
ncbi:MAG: DUF177 domain-containing protein [Hyphomicrobiaceae bacterium]|nr:DUF177 domain-containing protein [Hyphomicrobiaceae bacterium]